MKTNLLNAMKIASTIVVGATILTWNGGDTLEGAKAKFEELSNRLSKYETNENKLANRIKTLKGELEAKELELQTELNNKEEIRLEIEKLAQELEKAEGKYNEDIKKANDEITKANTQAEELQAKMVEFDTNTSSFNPMTIEELKELGITIDNGGLGKENWDGSTTYENEFIRVERLDNREGGGSLELKITCVSSDNEIIPLQLRYGIQQKDLNTNNSVTYEYKEGTNIEVYSKMGDLLFTLVVGTIQ